MSNHGDAMRQKVTPVVAPKSVTVGVKGVKELTRSLKAELARLQILQQYFGMVGGAGAGESNADSSGGFGNIDRGRVKAVPLQRLAQVVLDGVWKRSVNSTDLGAVRVGVERRHLLGGAKID